VGLGRLRVQGATLGPRKGHFGNQNFPFQGTHAQSRATAGQEGDFGSKG